MRVRALASLFVALAACSLVGCATNSTYFEPKENRAMQKGGAPVATEYMVPLEVGAPKLLMHAEAKAFKEKIGTAALPTIQVRFWVHNDSENALEFRLGEYEATDSAGNTYKLSSGKFRGGLTRIVLVPRRTRTYFDAFFNLPLDYDVLSPTGLTVHWGARIGTREYEHVTRFAAGRDRGFYDPFLQRPMGL